MNITINGVKCTWNQVSMTYEQLVSIAHPNHIRDDYSVTYSVCSGPNGTMWKGRSVEVIDGMAFSCMHTGNG